jgi:uncharacterized membrane protein YeaQ/YmgE (transglycosylase-associated protein family)
VTLVVLLLVVLLLLLLGGWVVGLTLALLGYALTGLVIGALARLVVPRTEGLGILATILYGIAGSLLGGILGDAFDVGSFVRFLLSVVVSALLIAIFSAGSPRRTSSF